MDFRRRRLFHVVPWVGVSILLWSSLLPGCAGVPDDAERLRDLLADHRPFVARLSSSPSHRPCSEPQPPYCEARIGLHSRSFAAFGQLAASASDPHVSAVALLVVAAEADDLPRVGTAVDRLETACDTVPGDALCRNDLAVARWVQGTLGDDLAIRAWALDHAAQALGLDGSRADARYNHALLLESAYLDYQALEAWQQVEATESDAGFRAEAARYRAALERPTRRDLWEFADGNLRGWSDEQLSELFGEDRQQPRMHLQDIALPAWGRAVESGDAAVADAELALATTLATRAAPRSGGRSHVLESLRRIVDGRLDDRQLRHVAAGYRLYGEAIALHEEGEYAPAESLFRRSEVAFAEAGDPFVFWSRLYLAIHDYHRPDYPAALAGLNRLRHDGVGRDPVALAYVSWIEGLVHLRKAHHQEALDRFESAAALFEAAGEGENTSAMKVQTVVAYERLGELDEAWRNLASALGRRRDLCKSRRLQNPLDGAASLLAAVGDGHRSLPFYNEWVREAERSGKSLSITFARAERAEVWARLGRVEEALAELDEVDLLVAGIDGGLGDDAASTTVALARARVLEPDHPEAALDALDRVRDFAVRSDAHLRLIEVGSRELTIFRRLGELEAADAALLATVDEIERQRSLLDAEEKRNRYLDSVHHVLRQGLSYYVDGGRTEEALLLAERLRAPVLRDRLGDLGLGGELRSLDRLLAGLGDGTGALVYAVLPERLVVWELLDGEVRMRTVGWSESELASRVERFRVAIRAGGDLAAAAAALAELLPAELPPQLERLVLVPDGPLFGLPFHALSLPDGVGRLLDRAESEWAYSLNTRLDLLARAADGASASPPSVLLVGDVEHGAGFAELARLSAESFDAWIRAYPGATVLRGEEATPRAFLAALAEHDLVVFAGHTLAPTRRSARGGLVLAPEGDDDGLLTIEEIEALPAANRLRMVALVSCSTGEGPVSASEGAQSVGRAFLSLGVPEVLVSLWPVEEAAAERLFTTHGAGRLNVIQLQRQAAGRGEPPATWAPFVRLGPGHRRGATDRPFLVSKQRRER